MAPPVRPFLLVGIVAGLVFAAMSVTANHLENGDASQLAIVSKGGNEWWVEAHFVGYSRLQVAKVEARDDDTGWTALTLRSSGNWAGSFHIEPGHSVHFRATVADNNVGPGGTSLIWSCAFTHPAGVEQCGQSYPYDNHEGYVFFDHLGGDANSVRLRIETHHNDPPSVSGAAVRVEGSTTWTTMQPGSATDNSGNDWSASLAIPAGKRVQFQAHQAGGMSDVWRDTSCLFTHPAGVEQCTGGAGPGMVADYTGITYASGVLQVKVDSSKQIAGVDARVDPTTKPDDESSWTPLGLTSGTWSKAIAIPSGAYVQFRTRATDGSWDVSYTAWQAPAMTLKSAPPTDPFTVEFRNVKGGTDWVQANPVSNKPVWGFLVREKAPDQPDYQGSLNSLSPLSWGGWAAPIHVPAGHIVRFELYSVDIYAQGGRWQETPWMTWPPSAPGPAQCSLDEFRPSCNIHCNAGDNLHMEAHDTLRDGTGWPRIHTTCGSVDTYCQANTDCSKDATTSTGGDGVCYLETSRTTGSCQVTSHPTGFTATFSNVKGNEWWAEAKVTANQPLAGVDARINCQNPLHPLKLQSWGSWAASFQIPAGSHVDFIAHSTSGLTYESGGYLWPSASTTSSCAGGPPPPPPPSGFTASFSGVRGNEWWEQAQVLPSGGTLAKVDVRLNGGSWQPLKLQTWGVSEYAGSYHAVKGTVVQLRATSTTGATALSPCYQWIPASGTDARSTSCGLPSGV